MKRTVIYVFLLLILGVNLLWVQPIYGKYLKEVQKQDVLKSNYVNYEFPKIEDEKEYFSYKDSEFELPINGASGYPSIYVALKSAADGNSTTILTIAPGEGFTIIEEVGEWWKVNYKGTEGYVFHKYCYINLPDVIPSIVYNITNASASAFKSSYKDIPNVTYQKLYDAKSYNERLGYDEYIVPVLYSMSKKVARVQQNALKNNETIIMYEAFRPYEAQMAVVNNLYNLAYNDWEVMNGFSLYPWYIDWFIYTGVSNHQQGYAMDISLGYVDKMETKYSGNYMYNDVVEYREEEMPSPIHELSIASTSFQYPFSPMSYDAWRYVPLASTMTEAAIRLQNYCTNEGLTPLASEWWHFNDLDSLGNWNGDGKYFITTIHSVETNYIPE